MGLIGCVECGSQISDKALACPNCGAPPEAYNPQVTEDEARTEASPEVPIIQVATHKNGSALLYDESTRLFELGNTSLSPKDAAKLDKKAELRWTRYDVRSVMHKAAKRNEPMGDLPVDRGPGLAERASMFFDSAADSMASVAGALDPANSSMICPHCQSKGTVHTRQAKQKRGVSGGKATAAVLTGGLSVLATGLSRKERVTEARCTNCGSTWYF